MKKHILLIEDDNDELGIFMDALNKVEGSFKCTYAKSADHALEILNYVKPDLIFIDFNLPKVNGLQFLSIFHSDSKPNGIRVFLYSTKITDEVRKMAKVLGAAGCIEKTNTINNLVHQLKAILNPALLPSYVFFPNVNSARGL